MNNSNMIEEAQALFKMSLVGGNNKRIPSSVSGHITKTARGFAFKTVLPGDSLVTSFTINTNDSNASVFSYLANNDWRLTMRTCQHNSDVFVLSLEGNAGDKEFSSSFIEMILRRCNRMSAQNCGTKDIQGRSDMTERMHSMSQFVPYVEMAKNSLPKWVVDAYEKNRLQLTSRGFGHSDEQKHAQKAIELLLNIDWTAYVPHVPSEKDAKMFLDDAFYGLDAVKEQILDVLAKIRRTGKLPKWGMLLVGPAGVGKTSIVKVIASLLAMNIIQMDMTTIGEDPEYISGTPRIYSNASAGKVIEEMSINGSSTFLLLLNEIDKAVKSGARSSADTVLTLLDKTGFYDNFIEEVIPTDNMFCIATCNDLSAVSKPMRDRFTIIELPAYSAEEKITIFEKYILPRFQKDSCVSNQLMQVSHEAVVLLATQYAVEPGVRELETYAERLTNNYCRFAEDSRRKKFIYTEDEIRRVFGPSRVSVRNWNMRPGMVKGAYFHDGMGMTYMVQAIVRDGNGKFEFIGHSSETIQNYAKVAYWAVKSNFKTDLNKKDVTVFITQSIPEECHNYLGMAVFTAICSSLLKTTVSANQIFIGGIDLYGVPYWDGSSSDLDSILRILHLEGMITVFAPSGVIDTDNNGWSENKFRTKIIEASDGENLLTYAMSADALAG